MNFLAHFALSNHDPDLILGNYLGDFLRVGEEKNWPKPVQQGIRLHRKIDLFTDTHPAVKHLRRQFSPERRRVSGIILDVIFDHFLLRNWNQYYTGIDADDFIRSCYEILERDQDKFPPRGKRFFHYLTSIDLLASYGELDGVVLALDQLSHRMRKPNGLAGTRQELLHMDVQLETGFNRLYPDLIQFCIEWRQENDIA